MPNTIVTVKYCNPATDSYKANIRDTEGRIFGCKDKLDLFEVGKTYRIEYSEKSYNGKTYCNVQSATPILAADAVPATTAKANGSGNGGNAYRETCAKDAERMFVCATLVAMIRAGEVKNDKRQLWEAVNMLKGLWHAGFADGNTFMASEAAAGKQARG